MKALVHEGTAITIEAKREREGRATVTVRDRGGERIALDTIRIAARSTRAKFVETLPDEVRAEAMAGLEALADRIVSSGSGHSASQEQGREIAFTETEPWPEPVDGADLLDELAGAVRRFAIVSAHDAEAIALWGVHTWTMPAFDVTPILCLTSPEKRCGKSTLLRLLRHISSRPLSAGNVSPASLFRVIEKDSPTLLLDEADNLKEQEDLRLLLNAGVGRGDAFVIRVVGDENEPRAFSVFGPKAIALIGRLPGTVEDRAVVVVMKRKMRSETVARMREREAVAHFAPIRRRIRRWADEHLEALREARASAPEGLNDRATDLWEPLLVIADAAGGPWPERAREAATALSGDGATRDESVKVQMLSDLRDALLESEEQRIGSAEFVERLAGIEERPWATWKHGKAIAANQVARLLSGFDGVAPKTIRFRSGVRLKGYDLDSCRDAFDRYLDDSVSRLTGDGSGAPVGRCHGVTEVGTEPSRSVNDGSGASVRHCHGVTPENANRGGEGGYPEEEVVS